MSPRSPGLLSLISSLVLVWASALAAPLHVVVDAMDLVTLDDSAAVVNTTRTYTPGEVNGNDPIVVTDLRNIDGTPASGLSFEYSGFYVFGEAGPNDGVWNGGRSVGLFTPDMAQDYAMNEGPGGAITLRGLNPARTYDIRWLAARSGESIGSSRLARYQANGRWPDGFAANQSFNANLQGWNEGKILQWSNVAPDASGAIRFDANGVGQIGSYAYLNALEIEEDVAIPTPKLDTSFAPPISGPVTSIVSQPDGKFLVGGQFVAGNCQGVVRLLPNGSRDTSFNAVLNQRINCLALQKDGKILVGGSFNSVNGQQIQRLVRLMPNGSTDTSFRPFEPTGNPTSILIQQDGMMIVVATFHVPPNSTARGLVRLTSSGSLDPGFTSANPSSVIVCGALQPDGKIVLGGHFQSVGGHPSSRVARLLANGSVDTSFTASGTDAPDAIAILPDGRMLVSGYFEFTNRSPVLLNSDGSRDASFSPTANRTVDSIGVQSDGQLVVTGDFDRYNEQVFVCFAKLFADGTSDPSLRPDVSFDAPCVHVAADGSILVGGNFSTVDQVSRPNIARIFNEPATSVVHVPDRGRVSWIRAGSAPELTEVEAELSTNNGQSWSPVGRLQRLAGGWQLSGLSLPYDGIVRMRGKCTGGQMNGSTGWIMQQGGFSLPKPRLTVLSGSGSGALVIEEGGIHDFGRVVQGSRPPQSFISLRNDGGAPLTITSLVVPAPFQNNPQQTLPVTIAPGAEVTMVMYFNPASHGTFSETMRIDSDDPDRPSATVQLTSEAFVPPPQAAEIAGSVQLNRQTGVIERTVRLSNPTTATIPGYRLMIRNLPEGVEVYNASRRLPDGTWVVEVMRELLPGRNLDVVVEYYLPTRGAAFTPQFETEVVLDPPDQSVPDDGSPQVDRVLRLDDSSILIEFLATPGLRYEVDYSNDTIHWTRSPVSIRAGGTRVQWIDRGPPRTIAPPGGVGSRFYRVRPLTGP